MLFEVLAFIAGVILLKFSSSKTVDYSVVLAKALKVSPIIIGIVLVSIGTDLPEIANSIISSYLGHGDINVGDTFGSPLAQITLVLALIVILGGTLKLEKKFDIFHLGIGTLLATLLAFFLVSDGFITRIDAVVLLIAYVVLVGSICRFNPAGACLYKINNFNGVAPDLMIFVKLILSIIGVIIASMIVVNSIVEISLGLNLPKFLVSFFVLGLGTSLPELMVDLTAIKRKQFGLAIGDIFGSNIVDLTLALGIGPLLFPNVLTPGLVNSSGIYLIVASAVVVSLLLLRKKVDRKSAIILLLVYLSSYFIIPNL
jgi:cation:H+ antiporter